MMNSIVYLWKIPIYHPLFKSIMRGTEIKVPDQSDKIPTQILKEKKPQVQALIADLPPCSPKYAPIEVPFRKPAPNPLLQNKQHSPLSLFQLFISSHFLQIVSDNTNLKARLERVQKSKYQRS